MASFNDYARGKMNQDQEFKIRLKNMSKEDMAAAIARKKECNARAMLIVEQLIEPNVQQIWLLENLKHINQSHFQDIVEERAITRFCGYPLCDEELTNVPKKMYKISTKENKVYDITDRKNYCSNICYKAGTYLKDQLYTSPLWLRDCEIPVEYKILSGSNERLPDMLSALELSHLCLDCEIQELVSTFSLGSVNICLRPPEWTLVAIMIIKLLTISNDLLNYAYSKEITQRRLITYLLTYNLDGGYIDRFTSYLMDIERIARALHVQ